VNTSLSASRISRTLGAKRSSGLPEAVHMKRRTAGWAAEWISRMVAITVAE
jgi:hypothetical protein